ncbi:MAG: hypothetical protein OHK0017_07430 [Patescibacteria group bacterium]
MNMFLVNKQVEKRFFDFMVKVHNYEKSMKIFDVDFSKPWWDVILRQKFLVTAIVAAQIVFNVYDTLFPVMIGWAISRTNAMELAVIIAGRIGVIFLGNAIMYLNPILQLQAVGSVEYSANKFFLTVDPIHHTTRSSGQIVAKVERGSSSFEDMLDFITFEVLTLFISLATVIITLWNFGGGLALTALSSFIVITAFNILAQTFRTRSFEVNLLPYLDKSKAVTLETLQQSQLIRSSFASTEQDAKIKNSIFGAMFREGAGWRSNAYIGLITRSLYFLSVGLIAIQLMQIIESGAMTAITATTLILTYLNGTNNINRIGDVVKRIGKAYARITDLYEFIRNFGHQTYPVLQDDMQIQA